MLTVIAKLYSMLLQPRDQFITRLMKKLKAEQSETESGQVGQTASIENQPQKTRERKGDQSVERSSETDDVEESWEDLFEDGDGHQLQQSKTENHKVLYT